MATCHWDKARLNVVEAAEELLAEDATIERMVVIDDLYGRIRLVVWGAKGARSEQYEHIEERIRPVAGPFWSGDIWHAAGAKGVDKEVYDRAWDESESVSGSGRLRIADRVRNRSAWFGPIGEPQWATDGDSSGPPIVVFYSFKGGVGRTTALASFAIQRSRAGERVAILDLDLDAPGIGTLMAADDKGTTAEYGVVDFMLEQAVVIDLEMRDYYHACRRNTVTGDDGGEVIVVPAGSLAADRQYLNKLARLDFDPPAPGKVNDSLRRLIGLVRDELTPDWICLDARAGLSEPAGVLLSGLAHLHVLFGTSSEQSWQGLRVVFDRIGAQRVRENRPQLDCQLVHAMAPQDVSAAKASIERFAERARDEFSRHYYAEDPADDDESDELWYVRDAESSDAPSAPVTIPYQAKLAFFDKVDDVADHLAQDPDFARLSDRIATRFQREGD